MTRRRMAMRNPYAAGRSRRRGWPAVMAWGGGWIAFVQSGDPVLGLLVCAALASGFIIGSRLRPAGTWRPKH